MKGLIQLNMIVGGLSVCHRGGGWAIQTCVQARSITLTCTCGPP